MPTKSHSFFQDASKVSLIPHHVGGNLTSHSPELCHILSRLLNLKNVSTKHFTSEKLASLVANLETLGRFLVSRSSYIQHKDFVRLTIGSHGWTTIRATYHTQKTGASVHHGSRILARRKLNCHVCSQGLRLMSQTQPPFELR